MLPIAEYGIRPLLSGLFLPFCGRVRPPFRPKGLPLRLCSRHGFIHGLFTFAQRLSLCIQLFGHRAVVPHGCLQPGQQCSPVHPGHIRAYRLAAFCIELLHVRHLFFQAGAQHRESLSQRIILHAGREQRLYELCSQLLLGALCRNAGKHPRCIYALLHAGRRRKRRLSVIGHICTQHILECKQRRVCPAVAVFHHALRNVRGHSQPGGGI